MKIQMKIQRTIFAWMITGDDGQEGMLLGPGFEPMCRPTRESAEALADRVQELVNLTGREARLVRFWRAPFDPLLSLVPWVRAKSGPVRLPPNGARAGQPEAQPTPPNPPGQHQ